MKKETSFEEKANVENEQLRARVKELEAQINTKQPSGFEHLGEIERIRTISKGQGAGRITYKDIHDHKNISLWHTNGFHIGKIVGPIHPSNAEWAFIKFKETGIILSLKKPSDSEIAIYKQTDEYKKLEAEFERRKKASARSKNPTEIDKLTNAISQMVGIAPGKVNQIKNPEEVSMRK